MLKSAQFIKQQFIKKCAIKINFKSSELQCIYKCIFLENTMLLFKKH